MDYLAKKTETIYYFVVHENEIRKRLGLAESVMMSHSSKYVGCSGEHEFRIFADPMSLTMHEFHMKILEVHNHMHEFRTKHF